MADEMLTPLPQAAAATDRPGPGERAARARQRFQRNFLIGSSLFGGVIGGVTVIARRGEISLSQALKTGAVALDPGIAVLLALGIVVGVVALPIYGFRSIDEVKVKRNLWAMAVGWFTLIGGYPAWVLLAVGGLLPTPDAMTLFAGVYFITMSTALILWLRDR